MDKEKKNIRNTAHQYSVVTPDVDHAELIAIEQDQPNNPVPPPPDPLDSLSWYMQPNASIQFLLYSMNVYIYMTLYVIQYQFYKTEYGRLKYKRKFHR